MVLSPVLHLAEAALLALFVLVLALVPEGNWAAVSFDLEVKIGNMCINLVKKYQHSVYNIHISAFNSFF